MVRKKVTPEIVEEMKRLREENLSYGKIANRLGLNPMTIQISVDLLDWVNV